MNLFQQLFPNVQSRPTALTKEQLLKVLKTLVYIALSGALSALIAFATDHKDMIGIYWPIVNFILVFLKQIFTEKK